MPFKVAEIVALFCALTALVFTAKVTELLPAATVTDAGTVATVTLLDTLTTKPPVGATPFKETVPTDELPPRTELGESVTEERVGGVIVRVADFVCPPSVAVIVDVVCVVTALVVTVKVAVRDPEGTVTDASTAEVELLDASETTVPDEPAGPVSVTVPIEVLPPLTVVGLKETEDKLAGVIDN